MYFKLLFPQFFPLRSFIVLLICVISFASSSSAATFTVTTTADSGQGSLRQAIIDANALAGTDFVTFNIPGTGVKTISPATVLPTISDPIILDATTQTGYTGKPLIQIRGNLIGGNGTGLSITAGKSLVRGFVIDDWINGVGISLTDKGENIIEANYIGVDPSGTKLSKYVNSVGISVWGNGNLIGGTTPQARNIISGNSSGIYVYQGQNNVVQGNYIGTDFRGTGRLTNLTIGGTQHGILLDRAANTLVGGSSAGMRNIISANMYGVRIINDSPSGIPNRIEGNYIGTNATGTDPLQKMG